MNHWSMCAHDVWSWFRWLSPVAVGIGMTITDKAHHYEEYCGGMTITVLGYIGFILAMNGVWQ